MTVENISWSISAKECCRPRRGLNPRPPGLQSDGASNWATEAEFRTRLAPEISFLLLFYHTYYFSGPICPKLKKLLANMTLKFLTWNMADTLILFAEKMWVAFAKSYSHFCSKTYQCIQGSGNFVIWIGPADDDDVINEPISKNKKYIYIYIYHLSRKLMTIGSPITPFK